MIQSISLIQAIVLLDKKEIVNRSGGRKQQELVLLEATSENIGKATELIRHVLGKDLLSKT
jgi:hypothetical protein